MALADPTVVQRMYQYLGAGNFEALRQEVFAADVVWTLPGRSVLAGAMQGVDEVLAFLQIILKSKLNVEPLEMHAVTDEMVIETHRVYGSVPGAHRDGYTATVYTIRNGKITSVNDYLHDQHEADHYFNTVFALKPIPHRLA